MKKILVIAAMAAVIPGVFASPLTSGAQAQTTNASDMAQVTEPVTTIQTQYDRNRDRNDRDRMDRNRGNQDRYDRDRIERNRRDYSQIRNRFYNRYNDRHNYYNRYHRSYFDRRYDFDRYMLSHRFYFDRLGRICGIDRYGRFFCVYFDNLFQYPYRFWLDTLY